MDDELTWKNHISSILKSIMKSTGLIAKLRHYTNRNTLKLIYYALAYPYLTYGNLVWGNTYPTRLQKLMNVQKKIVRLICFKSYTDHSEPLFLDLKILNIYKINEYLGSIFMYRFNHCQNLPDFYSNYFKLNNELHSYNTRNSTKFPMLATKGQTTVKILSSTREFLYGIVLMRISKKLIHIPFLSKKQNYIT